MRRAFVMGAALVLVALHPARLTAQTGSAAAAADDPFARHGWHLELSWHSASETWNYNISREVLHGLNAGLTYGLRDGLLLTLRAPLYQVRQRGPDAFFLGATFGVRGRVYRRGGTSLFLEVDIGVSESDVIVPPRGTRFNYLALGGGGATFRLRDSVHLLAMMRWMHVSNSGLAGRDRNPDIEAVGPQVGVLVSF